MPKRLLLLLPAAVLLLAACGPESETTAMPAAPAAVAASGEPIDAAVAEAALDVARYAGHVETLASDEFAGRAPFTAGETRTVEYLEEAFAAAGAEPGNGESYRQGVALVGITPDPAMALEVTTADGPETLALGVDFMAWTKRVVEAVSLDDSELVFVGYGVVAPEYGWDDYAGVDMSGRTAVILVNDPGFATEDPELFNGRAMTYYGRWDYKLDEAARQGAAGALIVHQTDAAGYPWDVVSGSWAGPQLDLAKANDNMDRVAVEGWLSAAAASALFDRAGADFEALAAAAASPDFAPVTLAASASIEIANTLERADSYNVIARIPGSERPDEVVLYMAHWDHLGTAAGGEPGEDRIYNGAVDNATGTAALLELAAAYRALPRAPKRSIVFLAVTAEESGLLGSAFYAENPVYPLYQTVAGINIDAMSVIGPTDDVVVIGWDASSLQDELALAAADQDRVLVREPTPEKGYFYRSDHFSFARKGVPVLYAEGGEAVRGKGREFGAAAMAEYTAERYHKPADEYDPAWDLSGTLLDIALYLRVGLAVAESEQWPEWREGNEFRAVREADLAAHGR